MPGPGFLEVLRSLRERTCNVLVLSMYPEEQFGVRALRAGAAGLQEDEGRHPHELLSEREFQVLQMLGEGCTVGEISDRLSLSPKTISSYRTRILKKLELRTTAELVRYAVENELVNCNLRRIPPTS